MKKSMSYGGRVRKHITDLLELILRVFFRLSSNMESENEFFPLEFYQDLVYPPQANQKGKNWIFDMPKLFDLAAIYGLSNPSAVKRLISNVFENEKRYIQDFKESVDMARTLLRTLFNKSR
jgi:hypothetical protein